MLTDEENTVPHLITPELCPVNQIWPEACSVYKSLLEISHVHSFATVYGRSHITTA